MVHIKLILILPLTIEMNAFFQEVSKKLYLLFFG